MGFYPMPSELKKNPVVELARDLIRVPSLTPVDVKDNPAAAQVLDIASAIAQKSGAAVTSLEFQGDHPKWGYAVKNLYLEWSFGKPQMHLCYIGHLDVVPPGNAESWSGDPYSGKIENGYLYGRGATDMKGSVAAFLTAMEEVCKNLTEDSNVSISMILTTDEEWAAVNGTRKVLEWLKNQGKTPDAFIVGEPSSQGALGSHIKVGRRGSLCGTFNAKGVQGHAAYKDLFENPNRALTLAATILNNHTWNDGENNFPDTNFETVAIKSGNFGESAIIPGAAELLWNIRFTPQQTPEGLEQWIKETLANPPTWAKNLPDAALLKNITVTANKDTASLPYYSAPSRLALAAQEAIKSVMNTEAVLDCGGGTTDGRFVAAAFPAAEIIELGLPEQGGMAGGMHQVDECVALADLAHLVDIFKETVIKYGRKEKSIGPKLAPHSPRSPG